MTTTSEKPERITVWAVYDNTDHSEGRGTEFVRAYTKLESTAKRLAKSTYVQGSDAPVQQDVLYKCGYYYFPISSRVNVIEPKLEDIMAEERAKTFDGVLVKAISLGLNEKDIEILKKGK
jgi:hypothetical protein